MNQVKQIQVETSEVGHERPLTLTYRCDKILKRIPLDEGSCYTYGLTIAKSVTW